MSIQSLVAGRLAYVSGSRTVLSMLKKCIAWKDLTFVSSDFHRQYFPLASDFGPVNLGVVQRFYTAMSYRISSQPDTTLVYFFEDNFKAQANASFLLGTFLMLYFSWTAEQAAESFAGRCAPFELVDFCDATISTPVYRISLRHCLRGLARAVDLGWYHAAKFDSRLYERLDRASNGFIHRICPSLIAFQGPQRPGSPLIEPKKTALPPEHFLPIFVELGVASVIRLNEPDTYDPAVFERAGIKHHDLYFDETAAPPDAIVERFLAICDGSPGLVAVHCRAGLGRTGTLAALWLMRRARFGADEAVGWLRIVRPGSVIGPQQEYLKACEGRAGQVSPGRRPIAAPGSDRDRPQSGEPLSESAAVAPADLGGWT